MVDRYAHTEPLMIANRLLSLRKIYIYTLQSLMYRYQHCLLPDVFSDFFTRNCAIHKKDTRNKNLFRAPDCKTITFKRTFRCTGAECYNYFYGKIDLFVTIMTYKKLLKSYLLENDVNKILQKLI